MQKKIFYILFFLIVKFGYPVLAQVKNIRISSPDKSIVYSLFLNDGHPQYLISLNGNAVIDASNIGIAIDKQQFADGKLLKILGRRTVNNTYPTRGGHSVAVNRYNEVNVGVKGGNSYRMEVRVFNDGVAFRYIVSNSKDAIVNEDLTRFKIPSGSIIWSQGDINYYEGSYRKQKIDDVQHGQVVGPPLTIQMAGRTGYAAITESGLIDFGGMSLSAEGSQLFKARLSGLTHKKGVIKTPWRVILIGTTLNQLVNSDLVSNLSPALNHQLFPEGYSTSWIKPGKGVWSWLAENGGVTFENMKKFSSWAGELGIEYNLVDEGWGKWEAPGKDKWALMKELVDYSKKRGVKIWAWKAYPDRAGIPGIKDPAARIAFFKKCKEIGIAGLKIDFFDSESQEIIQFYQSALKDAAKYHLMLDFHGANKPTGESRTWPNEMTREGIMGLEGSTNWAEHNTTLIFTRFLAGHADYTPLSFSENVKGTTLTHQLACVAAFTSPFMCLGVDPEKLLKSNIKSIVRDIPVIWDETIVLPQSEIGELAIIARRSGKTWYLIALNGESPKSIEVNLDFLNPGNYDGTLFEDVVNQPGQTNDSKIASSHKDKLKIKMSSGGGFLARFNEK